MENQSIEEKKAKRLTDWEIEPSIDDLNSDIRDAQSDFDTHVQDVEKWLNARDATLKVEIPKGQSRMAPKVIRKQNEWRYSSLSEPFLSSKDMFDVEPQTADDVDSATNNALIINKQFDKDINRVEFIDKYVRTAVDEGTAIVRVGWDYVEEVTTELVPKKVQMLPPEIEEQLNSAAEQVKMGALDPNQFRQMVISAQSQLITIDTDQFEKITKKRITSNRPTVEVCDYDRVMIDPTCEGDLDRAQFIVYEFISSKSELRDDPKYSNIDDIVFDNDDNVLSLSDSEITASGFDFKDDPRRKLVVKEYWGYWDIKGDGTTVPIVATMVGSTMIRLEENPFPDKKPPFVKVNYLPKRRDIYGGEPDAVLIEDHQDIIGALTRGMIDLMGKSANAQQGISADALDPAQKLRFEQGKDFIFNPNIDPSKAFWMATYPEIPQSAMALIDLETRDAEQMTSVRPFATGQGATSLNNTAAAVRTASDATAKREMGIIRRLSEGLIKIGEKIVAMNAINLSDEEIIRITDEKWVKITRDSLDGKFDLKLSVSTPESDQEQAQDLGFMLQTIGPNMDPGLQAVILGKIARLKKMPGLAEKVENYKPEPNPDDEKIKQLQIQLLEAQVANERAKGTENQADTVAKYATAELTGAKTQTELAKTRALNSGSDMTDLEFLKEQSGQKVQEEHDMMDKQTDNRLLEKAAESRLQSARESRSDEPTTIAAASSGSKLPQFAIGGDSLRGMDTPFENLADSLQP